MESSAGGKSIDWDARMPLGVACIIEEWYPVGRPTATHQAQCLLLLTQNLILFDSAAGDAGNEAIQEKGFESYLTGRRVSPERNGAGKRLKALAPGPAAINAPAMISPQKNTSPRIKSVDTPSVIGFWSDDETKVSA